MSVNGDNVSEASQQPVNNDDVGVFMATREEVEEYVTVISEDLDSLLRMKVHIKELVRSFDALVVAGTKLPRSPNAKAPAALQVLWIGKALDRIFAAVDAVPWNRNIINETQNRRQSLANDVQQADKSEWYDVSDDEDSQRAPSLGVNMHSTPMINRAVRDSQSGLNRDTKAEHQTVTPVPSQASAVDVLANELIKDRQRAEERRLNSDIFDKFDGNRVKFSEWMTDLLRNVDKDEVPEELKLSHLKRRLTGQALKHYTKQLYRPTWRDALQHLERNYRRHQTKEQKMAIFVNREQLADENVLDYAGVLQQLCPYDDWTSRESALKARLSDGLKREDFGVRAGVSADQGRCFHDIVEELAKTEEVEEKRGKGRGPPVSRSEQVQQRRESENDSWCTNCRRYTDHIASSCTQRVNRAAAGGQPDPRCFGCNGIGHKQAFCPNKPRATYNNWRSAPGQQNQPSQGRWGREYGSNNGWYQQGDQGYNRSSQQRQGWNGNAPWGGGSDVRAVYGHQNRYDVSESDQVCASSYQNAVNKPSEHVQESSSSNTINVVRLAVKAVSASDKPRVPKVKIGDIEVDGNECMLDTGAGCNLMTPKMAKKVGARMTVCQTPLRDVQGTEMKCHGEAVVKVTWPGWGNIKGVFHITEVVDHEVLIGCPLMKMMGMQLIGPDGTDYLGNREALRLVAAVKPSGHAMCCPSRKDDVKPATTRPSSWTGGRNERCSAVNKPVSEYVQPQEKMYDVKKVPRDDYEMPYERVNETRMPRVNHFVQQGVNVYDVRKPWRARLRRVRCFACSGVGHKAKDHDRGSRNQGYRGGINNNPSVCAQQYHRQESYRPWRRDNSEYGDRLSDSFGSSESDMDWRAQRFKPWQRQPYRDRSFMMQEFDCGRGEE